jgi:hypothetical protein
MTFPAKLYAYRNDVVELHFIPHSSVHVKYA